MVKCHLLIEILWHHLFREPNTIVGEEKLVTVGEHLLAVNLDDEWLAVPGSDVDGGFFIRREMNVKPCSW